MEIRMNEQPMSLENLPEYLKTQRELGEKGSPVVGMGQIVVPNKPNNWFQKIAFATIMLVAVGVSGIAAYDIMSTKQMTVIVDIGQNADPYQTIPKIVSDSGGKIIAVKQNDANTYEVQVITRRSRSSFLEWIRKSKDVMKADLED